GEVVNLGLEKVELPNGENLELEVVRHPGGAAVVALDTHSRVCLLRQYRHAAGGWLWELPAGKIDPPEAPQQTAQRELQEEAGLTADQWQSLGSFLSTPGFCDERIHLYLARNLQTTNTDCHIHEVIEVHWVDYGEAMEKLYRGDIIDAKTMLGLMLAKKYLVNKPL
ncbi:ADP-ribose pyrophosphatase, partial [hydrothermal vent metagenome]